jgi:hypothetical protein
MTTMICELYQTGKYTEKELGEKLGVSKQYIQQVLAKNGIKGGLKARLKAEYEVRMYAEAIALIREQYRKGISIAKAQKDIGVPANIRSRLWRPNDDDNNEHLKSKLFRKTKVGEIPQGFTKPCLEWTGYYHQNSPIFARSNVGQRKAFYWTYFVTKGEMPSEGVQTCGNRKCVEPSHIK